MKQNPNDLKAFLEALKPAPESDVQIPFAPVMPDELAQAAQLEAIQQAPAPVQNIEKPIVRAPAAQEPLKQATAPTAPEAPEAVETDGSRLERLMKDLNEQRNKEREDAASRQMKANIFKAIGESIGGMVSGAQAMNTKASVKAGPAPTINVGDLVADVDKRFSDDRKSLLDEYKALKSSQKSQGLTPYQEAMISLAMGNQGLKKDMFDQSHVERKNDKIRLDKENQDKRVTQVSDKVAKSGLQSLEGTIYQIEQELGMPIEQALKEGVDVEGFGRLGSLTPDIMTGDKGRSIRQLVQNLQNVQISKQYGASQTAGEVGRFNKEFGAGKFESSKTLLNGLSNLKRKYNEDLKNIHAGYETPIIKEYEAAGGAKKFNPADSNIVERRTTDGSGRVALFDSVTKEFKGYKD